MRELRLKEEKGVDPDEEFELDQAEMNYLEQEVKRITGEQSVGFQQCCEVITTPNLIRIRI